MLHSVFLKISQIVVSLGRRAKYSILLMTDAVLAPASLFIAYFLYGDNPSENIVDQPELFLALASGLMVAGAAVSIAFGLPRIKLNAYENSGIERTSFAAVVLGGIGYLGMLLLIDPVPQWRFILILTMVVAVLSVATRFVMRRILVAMYLSGNDRQRVLIYGAGQTGSQLAAALRSDNMMEPVAFLDSNPSLRNMLVAGLPVFPPLHIEDLIKAKRIDRIVLAMPSIGRPKQARIAKRLSRMGCQVSTLPSFATLVRESPLVEQIEPINPSNFLNRAKLDADLDGMFNLYERRTIMITGGGGSIGSELARQVLICRPAKLILFELSEIALYRIIQELEDLGFTEATEVVGVLGSVTDKKTLQRLFLEHDIDTVLHAAAYKHVNIVETNVLAGLENNVLGTRVVATTARDAGVRQFILVSTDKAVRPTNMMGSSKRLAELVIQDLASRSETTGFAIVRFGNVLGTSGSVVPLFANQIARGGPVTLTHRQVTRYFMTVGEAARLVLQAGNFSDSGNMFVLDMGKPVPIHRLAEQMIEAAGFTVRDAGNPKGDIEISIRGLMPGEKLHEELVSPNCSLTPTDHPKILLADEPNLSEMETALAINNLEKALASGDTEAARAVVVRWVGHYEVEIAAVAGEDLLQGVEI